VTQSAYQTEIAEWLREQRTQTGVSLEEVAAGIGVSVSSVSNWENGKSMLSSYRHAALRAYFKRLREQQGRSVEHV
jgi:transcriptional regulator with XRE-family HTH domain